MNLNGTPRVENSVGKRAPYFDLSVSSRGIVMVNAFGVWTEFMVRARVRVKVRVAVRVVVAFRVWTQFTVSTGKRQ